MRGHKAYTEYNDICIVPTFNLLYAATHLHIHTSFKILQYNLFIDAIGLDNFALVLSKISKKKIVKYISLKTIWDNKIRQANTKCKNNNVKKIKHCFKYN